jgi:hypothetical protein
MTNNLAFLIITNLQLAVMQSGSGFKKYLDCCCFVNGEPYFCTYSEVFIHFKILCFYD